jgi:hypothetical protein
MVDSLIFYFVSSVCDLPAKPVIKPSSDILFRKVLPAFLWNYAISSEDFLSQPCIHPFGVLFLSPRDSLYNALWWLSH